MRGQKELVPHSLQRVCLSMEMQLYPHILGDVTSLYPLILLTTTLRERYFDESHNSQDTFA